jgi:hypothetical protein
MKRFSISFVAFFLIFCMTFQVWAGNLSFQIFGGGAYNFRLPLVIRQDGEDNIRLNAEYDTKPFETPMYYAVRLGWWQDDRSWELELIHHKLYLENKPPEVEHFSITHGFNLLTVNRAWKTPYFIWRLGAGVVITHPESTVRGKTFEQDSGFVDGYYLSGPTAQIAAEKRFYFYKGLFISFEAKYTLSWVHVPIKDGSADLWNSAVHGLFGLGFDF